MPMATKLGRDVTYHGNHPPIKSHDHLILRSCKTTGVTKTIIFPLPQCLWPGGAIPLAAPTN